jgi:hypothetical protein
VIYCSKFKALALNRAGTRKGVIPGKRKHGNQCFFGKSDCL